MRGYWFVCLCVWVFVGLFVCRFAAFVGLWDYMCVCVRVCVCVLVFVCLCLFAFVFVCLCVCVLGCLCVRMFVFGGPEELNILFVCTRRGRMQAESSAMATLSGRSLVKYCSDSQAKWVDGEVCYIATDGSIELQLQARCITIHPYSQRQAATAGRQADSR